MPQITLHKYFNGQEITLDSRDIAATARFDAEADAFWHPESALPYTKVTMKAGCVTSDKVGTAYVSETVEEIGGLSL